MYPLPTPLSGIALHPLGAAHRHLIVAHLQRLDSDDRGLRFAQASITDAGIARYVDAIPLRHDALVGAFGPVGAGAPDRAPGLNALGHGCLFDSPRGRMVEGAFNVDEAWRGCGIGHALPAAWPGGIWARAAAAASCRRVISPDPAAHPAPGLPPHGRSASPGTGHLAGTAAAARRWRPAR
ncbi:MAG: hypothetical protein ACKVQR_18770 [Aquabacterium sp.]